MKREKLPQTRRGFTHSVELGTTKFYFTVGLYEDGRLGELFISTEKEGSTLRAILDAWAVLFSVGLQYGIPLRVLISKVRAMSFPPDGFTSNRDIPKASSPLDYLARWLEANFPKGVFRGAYKVDIEKADGKEG